MKWTSIRMIKIIVAEVLVFYIHLARVPDTWTVREVSRSVFWTRAPYVPAAIRYMVVSIEAMVYIHIGDVGAINIIISIVMIV